MTEREALIQLATPEPDSPVKTAEWQQWRDRTTEAIRLARSLPSSSQFDIRELEHLREFEKRVYHWLDKPWREDRWQELLTLMPEEWREVDNIGGLWADADRRLSDFMALPWWRRLLAYLRKEMP